MRFIRIVTIALLLVLGFSLVSAANAYVPRHGKPCRQGYQKQFKHVYVHKHVKRIRVCVKKRRAARLIPQKRTLLLARLGQTPTRHLDNPYEVTYDYGAAAQQEESLNGQTLSVTSSEMPSGVLALYSDGLLECTENVGGALEAANSCDVEYNELGNHKVTTIYTSSTESSAVSEVVTVDPIPTTTTLSEPTFEIIRKEPDGWIIGNMVMPISTSPPGGSVILSLPASDGSGSYWSKVVTEDSVVKMTLNNEYKAKIGDMAWLPLSYFEDDVTTLTAKRLASDGYIASGGSENLDLPLRAIRDST